MKLTKVTNLLNPVGTKLFRGSPNYCTAVSTLLTRSLTTVLVVYPFTKVGLRYTIRESRLFDAK